MWKAITCKENEPQLMYDLQGYQIEENERPGNEKLIAKAQEKFNEEVSVLEWEMGTLRACVRRIGKEWTELGRKVIDLV